MRRFFSKVISLIYPPKCIFCKQLLEHDASIYVCDSCYEKLPFLKMEIMSVFTDAGNNHCDGVVSVFEYTGVVKESLIRFKFYNEPSYYKTYARVIDDRVSKLLDMNDYQLVMSVPLHKDREFSRGYNQAYLISKELSRTIKLKECSGAIVRSRQTQTQSLLDKQRRSQNVMGAFEVTKPAKVAGKSILLVDDIFTTGATLEECSRVLKAAGAAKVTAVVVATGRRYLI
ncbi:MAG: ComF family protein [Clostridiaceae bacterium]|nr:ComF family protein [Clostridiaceae bacterium]